MADLTQVIAIGIKFEKLRPSKSGHRPQEFHRRYQRAGLFLRFSQDYLNRIARRLNQPLAQDLGVRNPCR
jgi:hypothetical protein